MEHLAFASALSLANKIQRKDMSARELLECYSIQEKDCLINALKQPEPIRSAGCRARGFLPVHW